MRTQLITSFAIAAMGVAPAALPAGEPINRYWVGGLVDSWDDPGNWSDTDGGSGGIGVPGEGHSAFLTNDSPASSRIILFNDPGNVGQLEVVRLRGTGSGPTGGIDLFLNDGNLNTVELIVLENVEIEHSAGRLRTSDATLSRASATDAGGRYRLSGEGLLDVTFCAANADLEPWSFTQDGGESFFVTLSISSFGVTQYEVVQLNSGEMTAENIFLDFGAAMEMNGGMLTMDQVVLNSSSGFSTTFVQNGGAIVGEMLRVGSSLEKAGSDSAAFNGGSASIDEIRVQSGMPGLPKRLQVNGGALDLLTLSLATDAALDLTSGSVNAQQVSFSPDSQASVTGGTFTVNATAIVDGAFDLTGGVADIDTLERRGDFTIGPNAQLILRNPGELDVLTMTGGRIHGGFTGFPLDPYLLADLAISRDLIYSGGAITANICFDGFETSFIDLDTNLIIEGDMCIMEGETIGDSTHELTARTWNIESTYDMNGGDINASLNQMTIASTGELLGPGSINSSIHSDGLIDIVGNDFNDPLTVTGSLNCEPTATLLFSITQALAVTHAPPIECTGTADLDGILRVSVAGNYRPRTGDRLTVLTAAEVRGTFDVVAFDLSGEETYDVKAIYTDATVELEIVDPICFGDANGDNAVNFTDLEILLEAWGTSVPIGTQGDVSCNGIVDFTDLNILLDNWGAVCP